jgi:dihydrofolate reductase
MRINFVVAMSENRVIGANNELLWHLPDDLKHFKALTIGKNIVMGRKTYLSLKRALPLRNNLVLSRDPNFAPCDVQVFHDKQDLLAGPFDELFVIGGEEIFRLFLPECHKIYLTLVHAFFTGDAYFPPIAGFSETFRQYHPADQRHKIAFSFIEYERNILPSAEECDV